MKKSNEKLQCYEFYVNGMHCAGCELNIERNLKKFNGVKYVDAKLNQGIVRVEGSFKESQEKLAKDFTKLVKKDGYEILTENIGNSIKVNWKEFIYAGPIAIILILIFFILQRSGLLSPDIDVSTSLIGVFVIGIVASLSSCAAVVGGLVLSVSANFAKQSSPTSNLRAQIYFHSGRLISFFLLGGLLGFLGGFIPIEWIVSIIFGLLIVYFVEMRVGYLFSDNKVLNIISFFLLILIVAIASFVLIEMFSNLSQIESVFIARFLMTLVVAILMIILGLNLLEIFSFTRYLQFKMPKAFSHTLLKTENINKWFGPFLLGSVTFFIPCGVTQTMQTLALETGSFISGSLMMFVYALGTLPVLALISFASINLGEKVKSSGIFFKTSGLLVITFAIYNIISAFAVI